MDYEAAVIEYHRIAAGDPNVPHERLESEVRQLGDPGLARAQASSEEKIWKAEVIARDLSGSR